MRAYFPTDKSLQFTMKLAERLYGITFVERKGLCGRKTCATSTHSSDSLQENRARLGGFYLDLYRARASTTTPLRSWCAADLRLQNAHRFRFVTNSIARGSTATSSKRCCTSSATSAWCPFEKTRYADQSGTSVKRDFVEAPSQMFEEWARREEAFKLLAEVCPECPRLTAAQIAQLDASRRYGQGILYQRQREYAAYDMKLHTGVPPAPMPAWAEIEGKSRGQLKVNATRNSAVWGLRRGYTV